MEELRVRDILNQRNISVAEFANMIGVSEKHCFRIVAGKNISYKQLQAMAQALNLPIRALFTVPEDYESEYNPYEIVYGRTEHYKPNDVITFGKLNGKYGAFSNMHTQYPIDLFGKHCYTSEHLFIALRFSGYPEMQQDVLDYKNSMWCKKTFVNNGKYKPYHHPNWHTNYFDVEVMKYVIKLKYEQNKGFRDLLAKTKGKILVEDTTMQNSSNSVVRWGCQDLKKKAIVNTTKSKVSKFITSYEKKIEAKEATRKTPRNQTSQERFDLKRKAENAIISKIQDEYEAAIYENCGFTLVGENALGKMLCEIRDTGTLQYNIEFPLFFFDHEIK